MCEVKQLSGGRGLTLLLKGRESGPSVHPPVACAHYWWLSHQWMASRASSKDFLLKFRVHDRRPWEYSVKSHFYFDEKSVFLDLSSCG